VLNHGR